MYATAYAVALLRGDVDGLQSPFDVHAMRGHLERCLEAGKLTPFPTCDVGPRRLRRKDIQLAVTASGVEVM